MRAYFQQTRMICLLFFVFGVAVGQHCGSTSICGSSGPAVCASNGATYANRCHLNIAMCHAKQQHQILTYSHSGQCSHSTGGSLGSLCHSDTLCDEETSHTKYCLSDSQTYESLCDAHNAQCNATQHHSHLSIVHSGECTDGSDCTAQMYACPHNVDYLCATNGYTYINDCYFKQAMCRLSSLPSALSSNHSVEILHAGKCVDNSTNQSRSVDCSKYADMTYAGLASEGDLRVQINRCQYTYNQTLCANGATYHDECNFCRTQAAMHKISYTQLTVPIAHDGSCHYHPVIG